MTDLLQPTLATQAPQARSLPAIHRVNSPDPTILRQTVLRWQSAIFSSAAIQLPGSGDRFTTLHHLVKRIAQIRASGTAAISNSSADSSPSLLEQVRPEAQAVLASLTSIESLSDQEVATVVDPQQSAQSLQTLIPWLLWNLVQTTHEAVQLIEGFTGQIRQAETWQSGTIRLVVGLKLTQAATTYAFDLVTQQALPPLLARETQIRAEDLPGHVLLQSTSTVGAVLQGFIAQLKTHSVLQHYWTGFAASWLIPHHPWQSGLAVLELGFEFIPTASSLAAQGDNSRNAAVQPCVKFSQRAWLEQHISTAVEHQLTQVLHAILPALRHLPEEPDVALAHVVEQGCAAMDELQCSLTLASRTFGQQPLCLDALGLRLLWNINRTAYELMQLTSGTSVTLLAPQADWQKGALRFVMHLVLRTPNQVWQWDLVQRSAAATLVSPSSDAIVQADHAWCVEPIVLRDLEAQIWQLIEQAAPEIAMLRTTTEAIITLGQVAELGTVQLVAAFEFTPVQDQET